jgi:hypothetical protein
MTTLYPRDFHRRVEDRWTKRMRSIALDTVAARRALVSAVHKDALFSPARNFDKVVPANEP